MLYKTTPCPILLWGRKTKVCIQISLFLLFIITKIQADIEQCGPRSMKKEKSKDEGGQGRGGEKEEDGRRRRKRRKKEEQTLAKGHSGLIKVCSHSG